MGIIKLNKISLSKMVKTLDNVAQFEEALKSSNLVVIDFTATWCPPCQFIGPKFVAMAEEFPNAVFVKVDVDANSETSSHCGINCMPTFQFYKNGVKVVQLEGADENGL